MHSWHIRSDSTKKCHNGVHVGVHVGVISASMHAMCTFAHAALESIHACTSLSYIGLREEKNETMGAEYALFCNTDSHVWRTCNFLL